MLERRQFIARVLGLLITLTVVLCGAANLWSQQPPATRASEATYSALQKSLNAKADEMLAFAARANDKPSLQAPSSENSKSSVSEAAGSQNITRYKAAIQRVQTLRPILEPILRQEEVPQELAAVVLVESGGQTTALSTKGARGLWQLMPKTARRYGLVVRPELDERIDIRKSTHAAARYLHDLYSEFGDWSIALAAYNAGEDRIAATLERMTRRDSVYSGISLQLPIETQKYVPAVLNAIGLITRRNRRIGRQPFGNDTVLYAVTALEN